MAGNSSEYFDDQKEFGFNKETYVTIPAIFLKYGHNDSGGWLAIKSMENGRRIKKKGKTLKDKILKFVPEVPILAPEPALQPNS
jgi:hypothetical protein